MQQKTRVLVAKIFSKRSFTVSIFLSHGNHSNEEVQKPLLHTIFEFVLLFYVMERFHIYKVMKIGF